MKIVRSVADWQNIRKELANELSIGFVPTMGSLHKGHASLIQRSKDENDVTVLSIFVNPTQFDKKQDYENYPSNFEADIAIASELNADYILIPDVKEIYPDGSFLSIDTNHPSATILEGEQRPEHFKGVLTVVMKLLLIVSPTRVYFGEKDYQQYVLIQSMIKDFFLAVDPIACPTIRETSGLPYSSRNSRLSSEEKGLAERANQLIRRVNSTPLSKIKAQLNQMGITIEYLEQHKNRIFSAINIGAVRIIDNFTLDEAIPKEKTSHEY